MEHNSSDAALRTPSSMTSEKPPSGPWNPEDYRGILYTLARVELGRRLLSKLGASDVVQNSLLQAHRNLANFRGESEAQFGAWMQKILSNELAMVVRFCQQGKRDVRLEQSLDASLAQSSLRLGEILAGSEPTPSRELLVRERLTRLVKALEQLPEEQREAVELRHLEQLTIKQTSERMNRSEQSVAGLLRRGLAQLRTLLQE